MKKKSFLLLLVFAAFLLTNCSESTSSDVLLLPPTQVVISEISITEFQITWNDNSDNEDGYKLERKFDEGSWVELTELPENADMYLDDIAARQTWTTVYYKVYSFEDDDISESVVTQSSISFPAPTQLTASYTDAVYLEWTDNSNGEDGFSIERKIDNGDYSVIATVTSNDTLYTDATIEEGYLYSYKVNAYISNFYSSYSNPVDVSTIPNILQADFSGTPLFGYTPLVVSFTDLSTGNYDSWSWDFGNGETSNESDPIVTFNEVGLYTVSLTVSSGAQSSTETKIDYIEVAEFSGVFQDGFEAYDDFAIEFSPWINLDIDGSGTYAVEGTNWPNAYDPQAFIIFNPSQTTPSLANADPHTGQKYAACFSSAEPTYLNNDWLITPQLMMDVNNSVTFWAKSFTDQYGLERFNVAVSTNGTDPDDFTIISGSSYTEAPTAWTEYTYDLSEYTGQSIYIAVQCVSADAFFLMVDDFAVESASSRNIGKTELSAIVNGSAEKCKK